VMKSRSSLDEKIANNNNGLSSNNINNIENGDGSKRKVRFMGSFSSGAISRPKSLFLMVASLAFLLMGNTYITHHNPTTKHHASNEIPSLKLKKRIGKQKKFNLKKTNYADIPICQSLWNTKGNEDYEYEDRQHSPLIFPRDDLMVCRTPKVGTAELRCMQRSYEKKRKFVYKGNAQCRPLDRDLSLSELHDLTGDPVRFNRYLYSDSVDRVMFVRHPVRRILSGFLQIAKTKKEDFWQSYGFDDQGFGPDGFRIFVLNSTFTYEYDTSCSKSSTYFSLESWSQHWAPPQHCRCGISECGVEWKVYKIEEHTIGEIMDQYIPGPWIPPYNITTKDNNNKKPKESGKYHSKSYDEKKYLTPDVLEFLNDLTKVEREFYGYEPIKF